MGIKFTRAEAEEDDGTPKKSRAEQKRYLERFDHIKKGKEAYRKENYPLAVENYKAYLRIISSYNEIDTDNISPKIFDLEKNVPEVLLISQIYWDLARVYDRVPRLYNEFQLCLNKYVLFTVGFGHQTANLNAFKTHLNRKGVRHKKEFDAAFKKVTIVSKKCFVATFCFGEDHLITNELRAFKKVLAKSNFGIKFIELYYLHSPRLIAVCQHRRMPRSFLLFFTRPVLFIFAKFLRIMGILG